MRQSYNDALQILRDILLRVKPAGEDGFEGLLASVIANLSGFTIRLAKSGSQFGRDASSTPDSFAIAVEAKRYSDDELRLEVLSGKVVLVTQLRVDLWIIGTTSTVGDDTLAKLTPLAETQGISLLCLDWTPHPIPPLCVALASGRRATLAWFTRTASTSDVLQISQALEAVAAHPAFASQEQALRDRLAAPSIGLDALRDHTAKWLSERLDNSGLAREAFGQTIRRASVSSPTVPRKAALSVLADALRRSEDVPTVVTVLGDEGVGKTWLVAQWWSEEIAPPIMVFVSGRRVRHLQAGDPVGSLARLLRGQHGAGITEEGWRARLERWKTSSAGAFPRFVLVLDGINEHPAMPWADIISGLARTAHSLAGTVVVSTRPVYWDREVRPRLGADLRTISVLVPEYDDKELAAALRNSGIDSSAIHERVREFMRNPRICAVAASMLDELSLQPDSLTVERLLFYYWRARLRDRGDLTGHSLEDFEALLQSHAISLRDNLRMRFKEDEWLRHSGAATRKGSEAVAADFTDVVEGRFLRAAAGPGRTYEFRPEVLPFALALLITHELWSAAPLADPAADELVQRIIGPVRGFDIISEIVATAIGLACQYEEYPDQAIRALIRAWFELQNKTDLAWNAVCAYFRDAPTAFLDAAEAYDLSPRYAASDRSLPDLILTQASDPRVKRAVDERIPRWLARWSRVAESVGSEPAGADRMQAKHTARIEAALTELTPAERELFSRIAVEAPVPPGDLQRLAALLCARRPMANQVIALMGWAFTQWIASDLHDGRQELEWAMRFNEVDPSSTQQAMRSLVARHAPGASERGRKVLSTALRLLGDSASASDAEQLWPSQLPTSWRRSHQFCSVDPFDPSTEAPSDLTRARASASVDAKSLWLSMSSTFEDADFEMAMPALARFDPDALVVTMRSIVRTLDERNGIPLRQLVWQLLELAPVFDDDTRSAVLRAFERVLRNQADIAAEDALWVEQFLFAAAAFEMHPQQQRNLIAELPDKPILRSLLPSITPLTLDEFEAQLRCDKLSATERALMLTCLFAPPGPVRLSADIQIVLEEAAFSEDQGLQFSAARAIERLNDGELDRRIVARLMRDPLARRAQRQLEHLIGAIAVRLNDLSPLPYLSAATTEVVAQHRPEALGAFADRIDETLKLLLKPLTVAPPAGLQMLAQLSDDGGDIRLSVEATASEEKGLLDGLPPGTYTAEQLVKRSQVAQDALMERALTYQRALDDADAAVLLAAPRLDAIRALVRADFSRTEAWLREILATSDHTVLRQVRNLGLALCASFAEHDNALAAEVFTLLSPVQSATSVSFRGERVPLWTAALFQAPDVGKFAEWRVRAFAEALSDAELEELVVSVESLSESAWLDAYINQSLDSPTPAVQARGLTAAGLRSRNRLSDEVLSRDWGFGFLADVAANARKNYTRARWVEHWLNMAADAGDFASAWCFTVLAERIADRRVFAALRSVSAKQPPWLSQHGRALQERLTRAQEQRTRTRGETLFGLKAPDRALAALLT